MKIREIINITEDNKSIGQYLIEKGLIKTKVKCYKCKNLFKIRFDKFIYYHTSGK